jgi:hypothetical protein
MILLEIEHTQVVYKQINYAAEFKSTKKSLEICRKPIKGKKTRQESLLITMKSIDSIMKQWKIEILSSMYSIYYI